MKAFLLAGGFGTRLKPMTDHTPKCLVEIDDKPLLQYWLEQLQLLGCSHIYINTHYLNEQVEAFVASSSFKDMVTLIHEPELLGTMGSIRHNRTLFDDDATLIAHADNFCLTDWQAFKTAYEQRPEHCDLTMMLFETPTPWSCGIVKSIKQDASHILSDYIEKPQDAKQHPEKYGNLANAAVFIASQKALDDICAMPDDCDDLCRDYLPLQIGKANVFVNHDVHIDIGTPETYAMANDLMQQRRGTA
ncbi:nucleotidyltransferase family protein [Paraneptunicella aestuarii]|uniref:nucleotidyltransferase family protein n=1 Tax=Paraneptunicella aestuarii TaxID=2831148 RepID=UPI001E3656FC|nr:nucleotidyltransferase family protein [Paraneptunicella aestuarii]UAA39538.1 nucleotidyltransferase family protein [Paraneptunicella aestuarii]